METNHLINLQGIYKHFPMGRGKFTALSDVNLNIGKGEFAGLVGPSGSGKTTLLNIIGSLDNPSEGEAVVLGEDIKDLNPKESAKLRKSHLGFIFQSFNLLPVYTVFENVEFPLLLLDIDTGKRKRMVAEALEWVGLTSKMRSKPSMLSGGECQRVAIARSMVKRPELVLADEPTANLDAENSHHILQTMLQLNKELETTFLFATHDEKVIKYLRRIIHLKDGMVTTDEIIQN
ncbi:MAG: ABC transporter ATP-binding protein [Bacteroidota bacterium]